MLIILYRALQPSTMVVDVFRAKTSDSVLYIIKLQSITLLNGTIIIIIMTLTLVIVEYADGRL